MRLTFSTYSLILSYVMSTLGISSIILAGSMDPIFVVSVCAIVFASLVMNVKKRTFIPRSLWNIIAIALFCFFILDYLSISGDLIVAASRFLMVMLAFKLFDLNRMRDHITVFALVFFQILAAAVSTVSPIFFIILSVFILLSMLAIIIFTLKRDFADARGVGTEPELPRDIIGPGFLVSIAIISVVSITMTMALFFVMPRMGVGFFERKTLNTVKTTGFNETVMLGDIGPVKTDNSVVMRVELSGFGAGDARPEIPNLYLRGTSLEHYDGMGWTREVDNKRLVRRDASGMVRLGNASGTLLEQRILLEPLNTEVLFAVPQAVLIIEEGESRKLTNLWSDGSGSLYLPSPAYTTVEYTVLSRTGPVLDPDEKIDPAYTDTSYFDGSANSRRIRDLVEGITSGLTTDMEKAEAITTHLLAGTYTYTLDPPKPSPGAQGDPIADFLLYNRKGYCEHYATSLALMLRAAGVPSRIVTGYYPDEWNTYGGYYIVRQQNAHSWVEAYIGGTGWVTLDPTPQGGVAPFYKPSSMMLYLDMLRWKWNRYVVQFSADDQRTAALNIEGRLSAGLSDIRSRLAADRDTDGDGVPIKHLLGLAAVAAGIIYLILKRGPGGVRGFSGKVPDYYAEMLRILEKRGMSRVHSETPLEFALRTRAPGAGFVTEVFQKERYAGLKPDAKEKELVKAAVLEISEWKAEAEEQGAA